MLSHTINTEAGPAVITPMPGRVVINGRAVRIDEAERFAECVRAAAKQADFLAGKLADEAVDTIANTKRV